MRWRSASIALVPLVLLASIALLPPRHPALAQSGGGRDLEWSVFGSAGDQFLSGSSYQLGFALA